MKQMLFLVPLVGLAGLLFAVFLRLYVIRQDPGNDKMREIADAIAELEKKFNGEGRVLIRPSGTEPLVRVMIEGKDQKVIDEEAKRLAELITRIML